MDDSTLYLVPTLTSDSIGTDAVNNGYTLNLTADGRCTGVNSTQCVAVSNITTGAIINPVQGVRLTSMGKASIRYGKVEVIARMPTGDWIWPAIWMMPQDNTYGEWPRSGEIDVGHPMNELTTDCRVPWQQPFLFQSRPRLHHVGATLGAKRPV